MLCQKLLNVLKLIPLGFYRNLLHGLFYESLMILIKMSLHVVLRKLTAEQNQWNSEMLRRRHSSQRVFIPPFFDSPLPPSFKKIFNPPLPNIILSNSEGSYADCFG